jgi:hypothetical protein
MYIVDMLYLDGGAVLCTKGVEYLLGVDVPHRGSCVPCRCTSQVCCTA